MPGKPYDNTPLSHFWAPRYWPTWILYGFIWLVAHLPFALQMRIGAGLGYLGYYLARRRRRICEINIGLCFPELSKAEQQKLVKRTFRSNGIGMIEVGLSWCRNPEDFRDRVRVHGLENIQKAAEQGKGILLVGAHFTTIEILGALFSLYWPACTTYRPNKNPLFEALMVRGRRRRFPDVIERHDVRRAFKRLREGHTLWYAPDQDYGARFSVFVDFFGVQAATITATSRYAAHNDSPVVFIHQYRSADDSHYDIYLSEPLENYPSGDLRADAQRINKLVEEAVRRQPDQYIWLHRRFKTHPDGPAANPYQKL